MEFSVLKGEDISKIPIKISDETDVYINEDSLKILNIEKSSMENAQYIKTK